MTTITLTKNNYFDVISLITATLHQKEKILIQLPVSGRKQDNFVVVKDKSRVHLFNQKLGGKKKEIILG